MANFYATYGAGSSAGGGTPDLPAHAKANFAPISNNTASVAVTFGTAFAAAPVVVAWLTTSDGSPTLLETIGNIATTAGFTATLSAPTPSANYVLNWMAASVYDA